jgi:hypothetical protein
MAADPLAGMYAAVEAIARGDVGEIEGVWDTESPDGTTTSMRMTVRREVQQINLSGGGIIGPAEDG